MDENLVEISLQNPLFIREESKRFIRAAIFNDSLFLSNLSRSHSRNISLGYSPIALVRRDGLLDGRRCRFGEARVGRRHSW